MNRRKIIGLLIFIGCIGGFFLYAYLLMLSEWSPIILQLTLLVIVGGVLGMISWIGYTMITTKPTTSSITSDDE